jgi:putative peptidoglycan lipid II flippase
MTSEQSAAQREINRNVVLVAAAFALAAATGLARNMVIARQFGIGTDLDAYYAAFKLPDPLFTVVAGGALATAFIPLFMDFLAARDRQGAWRFAAAVVNWAVLITGALAVLTAFLAPWLVRTITRRASLRCKPRRPPSCASVAVTMLAPISSGAGRRSGDSRVSLAGAGTGGLSWV